jgi:pyruvate dehydrogenase E1 component alpha subunit
MGDPERYRQSDEVKKWQENDPIGIYRRYLVEHKIIPENELNTIDEKIEKEVLEAVQLAEADPDPAADALFEHVYVEG